MLTNKEKIIRLKKIIDIIETDNYCLKFMCNIYYNEYGDAKKLFIDIPEILKYKPKKTDMGDAWFDIYESDMVKRIKILKKTIKDIQNYGKKSTK